MAGKIISVVILLSAALIGGGIYVAYNFWYYETVEVEPRDIQLTVLATGQPEAINIGAVEAIDAESSPIRYRACFDTSLSLATASVTFEAFEGAEPLNAPPWFDCFDAPAIARALDTGEALAFIGQRNIEFGIDRVVAITADGRGYVWHQLNECGDKLYDGTPAGDDCPDRDQ
ncbi:MAG: DUF6446 family protein [Pseudomonadota bacterium]